MGSIDHPSPVSETRGSAKDCRKGTARRGWAKVGQTNREASLEGATQGGRRTKGNGKGWRGRNLDRVIDGISGTNSVKNREFYLFFSCLLRAFFLFAASVPLTLFFLFFSSFRDFLCIALSPPFFSFGKSLWRTCLGSYFSR
jgi:hypothetical protein